MGLYEEGIRQAKEASEIFERIGDVVQQAYSLINLALVLRGDGQPDAAKEAASRAIDLLPEKGEELRVCTAHRTLGEIYERKGKMKKAIRHLEIALDVASSHNMTGRDLPKIIPWSRVFTTERKFGDAQILIERTKSLAADNPRLLAFAMNQQARIWIGQHRFDEARSEALRAFNAFEQVGDTHHAENARGLLQQSEARQSGHPWWVKWRW